MSVEAQPFSFTSTGLCHSRTKEAIVSVKANRYHCVIIQCYIHTGCSHTGLPIPAPWRLRPEECNFKTCQGYKELKASFGQISKSLSQIWGVGSWDVAQW